MVDESGGDPVSRDALAWSVPNLGKSHTERLIEELETDGRIIEVGDGVVPNSD
jgi:hypothetical protein